jgi:hypothetical protein
MNRKWYVYKTLHMNVYSNFVITKNWKQPNVVQHVNGQTKSGTPLQWYVIY